MSDDTNYRPGAVRNCQRFLGMPKISAQHHLRFASQVELQRFAEAESRNEIRQALDEYADAHEEN